MVVDILFPTAMFILGWLLNICYNKYISKHDIQRQSAMMLWELSRNWYEQINTFINNCKEYSDANILEEKMNEYVGNRLVLPDYIYHLEVIKESKKYFELHSKCEKYFHILTNKNSSRSLCRAIRLDLAGRTEPIKPIMGWELPALDVLDSLLQDIAKTSGRLIVN